MQQDYPKHIIAVSAYIENHKGEVLLVKTHARADTWESPGGQVEIGEPLDEAVCREVFEETGLTIRLLGVTGVYYNTTMQLLAVVFKARYETGELKLQADEIKKAKFIALTECNISDYITRPNMKSRTLDAMRASQFIPYETWETRPNLLIGRLGN